MSSQENVLVLLLDNGNEAELRKTIAEHGPRGKNIRIVAPANLSKLAWLASDEDGARVDAAQRAAGAVDAIQGQVRTDVDHGEADTVQAVEDALREFPAQEILVVGGDDDPTLERSLEGFGLPISHLASSAPAETGGGLRATAVEVAEGRNAATPFAALAGVQLVVIAVVAVIVAAVAIAFWLA